MTQQINLIDPSLLPQHEWLNGRTTVMLIGAFSVALAAHWWAEHSAMRKLMLSSEATAALQADPAASAPLDEVAHLLAAQQNQLTRSEQLLLAVQGLGDLPQDSAPRLRALIGALPETAWLQEVEFIGTHGVRIVGGATQADAITRLAERLNVIPAFQGQPLYAFALAVREPDAAEAQAVRQAPRYGFVLSSLRPDLPGAAP